ncbi:MAG TPA: HAD family phosphatase [Spirochaetota bacterium]|nr:HAD family phosphatase [Spirochaetota bacterium]HOL56501.1 HAD family phosphatase [Spirochaetota bacterium]HPP03957.1 HAD family phosphatase [Spirochaetota bacterium]
MKNIEGVIFDLDGTLIDSENNYYLADKKLLEMYGIDFTEKMKAQYIGTGNLDMMKKIKEIYNIPDSVEFLHKKKNELYLELARRNTVVFPEMKKLLEILREKDYKIALASGSSKEVIDEIMVLTGLNIFFDAIVAGDEVVNSKPAPDIFILAAKRLNIEPERLLVIEDSKYGVEAAKNAGMLCIAIPSIIEDPFPEIFYKADFLFKNGMKDFQKEKVLEWLECCKIEKNN